MRTLMSTQRCARWVAATALIWAAAGAAMVQAQPVGEVEFTQGAAVAQSPGQLPRTMGKGLALNQGDRLTTAQGASSIIKLRDGTRMTLRPGSELVVQSYRYQEGASDNSMVLQLVRGGLRAITGLVSKDTPDAAKIQTPTATLGIRGTDFDARICGTDCQAESAKVADKARRNAVAASAKLVAVRGEIFATDVAGNKRRLSDGGSVYPGDVLQSGAGASAIVAFRDESRITLGANSQFRLDSFVFDAQNPGDGRFLVSLLQGSMRAVTGLVGKSNTRNVGFKTATATIGIRGTGLDLDCAQARACSFFSWLGTIEVQPNGQTALQVLQAGQGLFVSDTEVRALAAPTLDNLPRPDTVPVNFEQLFSVGGVAPDAVGVFVWVRDGHIQIVTATEVLDLGRGEVGLARSDGTTGRPDAIPLFLQNDPVLMPNRANPMLVGLLREAGSGAPPICR